jgi:hypothetical protein
MIIGKIAGNYNSKHTNALTSAAQRNAMSTIQLPMGATRWHDLGKGMLQAVDAGGHLMGRPVVAPVADAITPTAGMKAASTIEGGSKYLGNLGSSILPYLVQGVGRTIEGAGKTAGAGAEAVGRTGGAVAQALGNIPSHMSMASDQQKALYGKTPMDMVGGITSDVGKAAGVGLSSVGRAANVGLSSAGEALGGTIEDIGSFMRMQQLFKTIVGNPALKGASADLAGRALTWSRGSGGGFRR